MTPERKFEILKKVIEEEALKLFSSEFSIDPELKEFWCSFVINVIAKWGRYLVEENN